MNSVVIVCTIQLIVSLQTLIFLSEALNFPMQSCIRRGVIIRNRISRISESSARISSRSSSGTKSNYDLSLRIGLSTIEKEALKPDFLKEKDSKHFEFQRMEEAIYKWWEESGYFEPSRYKTDEQQPFVLPMPPPNVTGYLHMGHAIFIALQDIMARFQRMRGRPTLWLPGTSV